MSLNNCGILSRELVLFGVFKSSDENGGVHRFISIGITSAVLISNIVSISWFHLFYTETTIETTNSLYYCSAFSTTFVFYMNYILQSKKYVTLSADLDAIIKQSK